MPGVLLSTNKKKFEKTCTFRNDPIAYTQPQSSFTSDYIIYAVKMVARISVKNLLHTC